MWYSFSLARSALPAARQGERWSAYLEKKDGDTADLSKSAKLRRLVIKGIPGEKRGDLWSTFLGKKERYAKGLYETLVKEMETTVTAATQQVKDYAVC